MIGCLVYSYVAGIWSFACQHVLGRPRYFKAESIVSTACPDSRLCDVWIGAHGPGWGRPIRPVRVFLSVFYGSFDFIENQHNSIAFM